MFHFFERKRFLVDYLKNFVDIHNHILPGIDDGAKTVDESIALVEKFSDYGITNFICTPHIMNDYYPNTSSSINKAKVLLNKELLKKGMHKTKIRVAAEHMIDNEFEQLIDDKGVMLYDTNHILVEMSYLQAYIDFDQSLEKIVRSKYLPILAHPERYIFWHKKKEQYKKYSGFGVLFQLNLLSLGTYYGTEVKASAVIRENQIDFVATDVHHMGHLNALSKLTVTPGLLEKLHPIIDNTIITFH